MPSLYESTVNTGEVSSSNFTTLYNASGLSVPNAGAGSVTGNLNVGGNLTVQGNSLLIGDVTLQGTLCLPNYCFPLPDGNTDQVMVTDGNGNLYWTDVSAIPGADYNISATTATGGANLTLANTAGFTDSVKFAAGTNMSIVRTDANTITIATVADNIPDGTAQGQLLVWDGSAWTANSQVTTANGPDRLTFIYENSSLGPSSVLRLRKDYGATPYTTNDGAGIGFQLQSDSQVTNQIGFIATSWDPVAPSIILRTNINNNTSGPFVTAATFTTAQATLPGDLAVNGGDITTTQTTGNLFNATATTVNIGNGANTELNLGSPTGGSKVVVKSDNLVGVATTQNVFNTVATTINLGNGANTEVNIGSPTGGSKVVIKPETIVGINATQAVFNSIASTVNAFGFANTLNMGSATSLTTLGNNLSINGETLKINADNTASVDSNIYFNGTSQYLKWNYTDQQFELSDTLFISQSDTVAIFERKKTTADLEYEGKTTLKSIMRVTDAASNATDDGGSNIIFSRTSGASGGPEVTYGSFQFDYYGTNNTAEAKIVWSNDNFTEPSPGSFPSTYLMQQWNEERSQFNNNSLFVNYAAQGTTHTATSIITSNTLVFGSAHGYTANDRIIYTSTTQNGLTQNIYYYVLSTGLTATQCQLGLSPTTGAVTLTNGTGLTLVFADLINRVGVNTGSPDYTLDVNGEANVETTLTVPSITTLTGDDLNITAFSGRDVTISTTEAADPVTLVRNLSTNSDSIRTLTLRANTTNASPPVIGFGNYLEFETESQAGTFVRSGGIDNKSTGDNGSGVLDEFDMTFSVMSGGTNTERMVLDNLGNLQIDGDLTVTGTNINTGATDTIIQIDKTSSDTATSNRALNLLSTSTGTPTVGFGTALGFQGQTAVSTFKDAAFIAVSSTDVTPGSEDFTMAFGLMQNGAAFDTKMELNSAGDLTIDGDLAVNGNDLTTTQTTFNLLNATATTVNAFGASTATNIGSTLSGTTTIGYDLVVNNDLTVDDINTDSISFPAVGAFATLKTQTTTTTLAGTPVSISGSTNVSQKATIKIVDNVTGEVHMLEALAFRSGTAGFLTTYAEMYSSVALATFTVTGTGGVTNILANPISSNSTTFNVVRLALD